MKKSDRDIMEILKAYDTTGTAHSAAHLAGVDPKTVRRYVAARDTDMPVTGPDATTTHHRRLHAQDRGMGRTQQR